MSRKSDWTTAGQDCIYLGLHKDAHLLIINNTQEQAAVANMLRFTSGQYFFHDFIILNEYKKLHSLQSLVRTNHRTKTTNITKDDATRGGSRLVPGGPGPPSFHPGPPVLVPMKARKKCDGSADNSF